MNILKTSIVSTLNLGHCENTLNMLSSLATTNIWYPDFEYINIYQILCYCEYVRNQIQFFWLTIKTINGEMIIPEPLICMCILYM